jgi:hypothetical protein
MRTTCSRTPSSSPGGRDVEGSIMPEVGEEPVGAEPCDVIAVRAPASPAQPRSLGEASEGAVEAPSDPASA